MKLLTSQLAMPFSRCPLQRTWLRSFLSVWVPREIVRQGSIHGHTSICFMGMCRLMNDWREYNEENHELKPGVKLNETSSGHKTWAIFLALWVIPIHDLNFPTVTWRHTWSALTFKMRLSQSVGVTLILSKDDVRLKTPPLYTTRRYVQALCIRTYPMYCE